MVLRRAGLENLWPLDDALPKWHDDSEIGLRIRKLGYLVLFNGACRVLHHPGHSDPQSRYDRQRLAEMARLRLLWKYYPAPAAMRGSLHYAFFAMTGARRRWKNLRDLTMVSTHLLGSWREIWQIRRKWIKVPKYQEGS
jgi:GT2 family glycosyltransferase